MSPRSTSRDARGPCRRATPSFGARRAIIKRGRRPLQWRAELVCAPRRVGGGAVCAARLREERAASGADVCKVRMPRGARVRIVR